jgi:hypothetical protein
MTGIEMFTTICSNLQGGKQFYRFFDRLGPGKITRERMLNFLERYPQYWQKINPEETNAKAIES